MCGTTKGSRSRFTAERGSAEARHAIDVGGGSCVDKRFPRRTSQVHTDHLRPPLPSSSRPASVKGQHATRPIAEFDARPLSVEGQTARWGREASPAQRDGPSRQLSPLDRSNDGRARRKPRDWSTVQQIHSDLRSASKITCAESRVCQASERVHSRPPLRPTKIKFCVAAISVRTNSARSSCSRHPSEPRS